MAIQAILVNVEKDPEQVTFYVQFYSDGVDIGIQTYTITNVSELQLGAIRDRILVDATRIATLHLLADQLGKYAGLDMVSLQTPVAVTITSLGTTVLTVGTPANFRVTTIGNPVPKIVVQGIFPPGLSGKDNSDGTAEITGTPLYAGTYTMEVLAANAGGGAVQPLILSINNPGDQAPTFTSAKSLQILANQMVTLAVTTLGSPTPVINSNQNGMPQGMEFVYAGYGIGALLGQPMVPGLYNCTLTAVNAVSTTTQSCTITVDENPTITSSNTITFTAGQMNTFPVNTKAYPPPVLTISALPPNLVFIDNGDCTGSISGVAVVNGGIYTSTLTAVNSFGTATQKITITVDQLPTVTSANTAILTAGTTSSFEITTAGYPIPAITVDQLPAGLTLTDHGDGTGAIAGDVQQSGTYTANVSATNTIGVGNQALTIYS